MSRSEEKAKRRWWPTLFRIRTLAVLVTLMCAYFATWGLTKRHAERLALNLGRSYGLVVNSSGSPAPLIVYCDEYLTDSPLVVIKRHYYFWLLGPLIPARTEEDSKFLLVLGLMVVLVGALGFAWRTNRIDSIVPWLIILFIVGVVVSLLLPAVQSAR